MQQHPVPQNVTQYQFRLVGDMTLKQFLELLGGLVVAYLFYASNLIFIIKWPLALLSLVAGFGLAFFPIEDRPLDQWVINFLKSIYSPTRYIWKKSNKVPSVFTFEAHPVIETVTATKTVKAPSIADLQPKSNSDISDEERQRINVLDAMLAKAAPAAPAADQKVSQVPVVQKPSVTVRKLKPLAKIENATIFQSAPRPAGIAAPIKITLDKDLAIPKTEISPIIKSADPAPQASTQGKTNVIFSKPEVKVERAAAPTAVPQQIHLPAAPAAPNLVVGMVVDKAGKIVENAIVQIMTDDGIPARAIKTNSLGQFYTSTPLGKGTYTIEVELEGHTFPPNKLVIEDKIVSPILLRAS